MSKSVKKKWLAVFKAGVWGGLSVVVALCLFTMAARIWGSGQAGEFWPDTFLTLAWILSMPPSLQLSGRLGYHGWLLNPYLLEGLLGSIASTFVTMIWQFSIKPAIESGFGG